MNNARTLVLIVAISSLGLAATMAAQQTPVKPAAPKAPATAASHATTAPSGPTVADQNALVQRYCVGCHNDRNKDKVGQLTLASFDMAKIADHAETGEKMI